MDYRAFLKERAKSGIVLGISNMSLLMERLKNPQNSLKITERARWELFWREFCAKRDTRLQDTPRLRYLMI